jgi:hypothetical protein
MSSNVPASRIMLRDVRLSFAQNLFVPGAFKPGDKPKYSSTFLIPKGSPLHKAVEAAALFALDSKFPGKGKSIRAQIEGNNNKCCIQDGDKSAYEGYEGHIAVKANTLVRPTIMDRSRALLETDNGRIYSGCYVNGSIEFFGYDSSGKGLSANLRGVQFWRDGDSFGGGRPASADEFEAADDAAQVEAA